MDDVALEMTAVSVAYRRNPVLRDITCSIPRGSTTVLVGGNGAGKTTLVKTLAGLIFPDSGSVRYVSASGQAGAEASRGFLFEEPNLYPHLRGRTNLRLLASGADAKSARLASTCAALDLDEKMLRRRARGYSFGQRRKVTLAALFAQDSDVMVLDEPTNGLDPDAVAGFLGLVSQARSGGRTMLITGQDHAVFEEIADAVWVLDTGRLTTIDHWRARESLSNVLEICSTDPDSVTAWFASVAPDKLATSRGQKIELRGTEDELRALASGVLGSDVSTLITSFSVRPASLADLIRSVPNRGR